MLRGGLSDNASFVDMVVAGLLVIMMAMVMEKVSGMVACPMLNTR